MLVVREQSVNMASKAILLLLIGTCAVEVFSVNNCPIQIFVDKHVCKHCSNNINEITNWASHVETTVMRSRLTTKQTIYSTGRTESRDWNGIGNECKSKEKIPRFFCKKEWSCEHKGDDWARHRLGSRCPDENQNLCCNCLKDGVTPPVGPLEKGDIDLRKVQKKALETEKARYDRFVNARKQYTPISEQDIYVLKDDSEALKDSWHSPINDRQYCKLKEKRPKYKCNSRWVCNSKGQGYGTHDRTDGHLKENL